MIFPSELDMACEELGAAITRFLRAPGSAADPNLAEELDAIKSYVNPDLDDYSPWSEGLWRA